MPLLTSTMLHKGVRLGHETSNLSRRNINIVHVKRPELALVHEQPGRLLTKPMVRVCLCVGHSVTAPAGTMQRASLA